MRAVVCPVDYRCGRNKLLELANKWQRLTFDSSKYGVKGGEQCSYELKLPSGFGGPFVEVEIISATNTDIRLFSGSEDLLVGVASSLTTTDGVKQFNASEKVFLVTDFTDDTSSFSIEYRMSSVPLVTEESEEEVAEVEEVEAPIV